MISGGRIAERMAGRLSMGEERKDEDEAPGELIGMCMHEVRNLESAAFERIHQTKELVKNQVEEVSTRLQSLYQQVQEERSERAADFAELRRDLSMQRDLQSQVVVLRQEFSSVQVAVSSLVRGGVSSGAGAASTQSMNHSDDVHQAVAAMQAAVADVRNELLVLQERIQVEAQTASMNLDDVSSELRNSQAAQMQDLNRSIQEVTHVITATQGSLMSDVRQEIAMTQRESANGHHFHEDIAKLSARLDECHRLSVEVKQDKLSEATVLRGRLEAAMSDREEQISQVAMLRQLLSDEQTQRTTESHALLERLEYAEQQLSSTAFSQMERPALLTRLDMLEAAVRSRPSAGASSMSDRSDNGQLDHLMMRIEKVEQLAARASSRDVDKSAMAIMARVDDVEARCAAVIGDDFQQAVDGGVSRCIGELDAQLKMEFISRIRALCDELRGEVRGEFADQAAALEARAEGMEVQFTERLRQLSMELGVRAERLEAVECSPRLAILEVEVRRHSQLLSTFSGDGHRRVAATSAIEAIEQDVRRKMFNGERAESDTGILVEPCKSPPGGIASAPVPPRKDTSQQVSRRHMAHRNIGFATDAQSDHSTSTPVSDPAGEGRPEMPALSEGLRQSLDGLVNAVHRTINTSHKKFGAGGAPKSLGGSDQSARSSRGSGNHFLELEADQGSGQAYMSASPRRISAQLDSDIGFAGQHAQVQVVSRPHSPMRATQQQTTSSPYHSRPVSPMQRARDIDVGGPAGTTGPTRMWTYSSDSGTGSVQILREAQDVSSGVRILSEDANSGVQIVREASGGVQNLREAVVPYRGEGPPRATHGAPGGSSTGSDSGLLSSECSPMTATRGLQGVSILRARPPYSAAASPPQAGKGGAGSAVVPHGAITHRGRLRLETNLFPCGSLRS
mmetsp:Transcript_58321/g.115594  ORF Transcript_58321/g.115594 Transcript_58321/m.115594 type:complete len:909 (+) Transcript_58321:92-2818(+)